MINVSALITHDLRISLGIILLYKLVGREFPTDSISSPITKILKTTPAEMAHRVEQILTEMRDMSKDIDKLTAKLASIEAVNLFNAAKDVKGVNVIAANLKDSNADALRSMGDAIREKEANMVAVLATATPEGKVLLQCVCGKEAVKKGAHAGKIIKEVAKMCGGGGGGRPDSATAGGKNPAKVEEALEAVNNIVEAML